MRMSDYTNYIQLYKQPENVDKSIRKQKRYDSRKKLIFGSRN